VPTSEELLNALLDAEEAAGENELVIHAKIHERRRKRAHAIAKATQPVAGISVSDWGALVAFLRAPLTAQDSAQEAGSLDHLLLTAQDAVSEGNQEDAIFAVLRVFRKSWAWNAHHLGPIEGLPQPVESPVTDAVSKKGA
jgi:hypothetical protein